MLALAPDTHPAVGQDQLTGVAEAGQAAHQGDFPGAAAGQLGVQHEVRAHLDQAGHPHLGKGTLVVAAGVVGAAEGGLVGGTVGNIPAGPVHRQ